MAYAKDTRVPVERTRLEIEHILDKYGASHYGVAFDRIANRALVSFQLEDRRIRFELALPPPENAQQVRSRWRSLLMCIKAKMESVASNIETFDEAFLPHLVMRDGRRFGEIVVPQLEQISGGGQLAP